jgi:hypothetical protein
VGDEATGLGAEEHATARKLAARGASAREARLRKRLRQSACGKFMVEARRAAMVESVPLHPDALRGIRFKLKRFSGGLHPFIRMNG